MVKQTQKESSKRYYEKHKEEIKARRAGTRSEEHKSYYERNKERIKQKQKAYHDKPEVKKRLAERLVEWRLKNPEKRLLASAKRRASKLNLDFNLELTDIVIPKLCPLLGVPIIKQPGEYDFAPSLDRIDNTEGYTKDNIWIISFKANRMKNTATLSELHSFCQNWIKLRN